MSKIEKIDNNSFICQRDNWRFMELYNKQNEIIDRLNNIEDFLIFEIEELEEILEEEPNNKLVKDKIEQKKKELAILRGKNNG